ncbi:MAG: SulP family inorganic anion transporter [Akkermansia sp.]|nr:SulP family inorganic anion transporter [Akkermansia sp.]
MHAPALIKSLRSYNRATFLKDLGAGLTVGVVALPLAMAFAIAVGSQAITPSVGLVTAVVAGFMISLFGGSKFQIGGPTGAFVVLIASVVGSFGVSGLVLCTLLAGLFLVLFGVFRMGSLIKFIPYPVTTGFTSGIAVTIFCTQVKDILGLQIAGNVPADFFAKWQCYFAHIDTVNPWAVGVTLLTIALILLTNRLFPRAPHMLVGMLITTVICQVFSLPVETIGSRFGELPHGLPMPTLPEFEWSHLPKLIQPAFVIALLAAIESLLSASVADGMTGSRHHPNTELIGQGIGNICSALFGGLPATGAIARTATNIRSGAKTPVSGLIHAVTLLLILLLAGEYATMVPLAALAGILVIVCYNMAEVETFAHLLHGPRQDALVLCTTFLLTVVIDLVVAVEVGVVMAALLFIGRMAQISNVADITNEIEGNDPEELPERSRYLRQVPDNVEIFDVQGPFFFGAVEQFKDMVFRTLEHDIEYVLLRLRLVPALDATGLHVLEDFLEYCHENGVTLLLCGVQPQPMQVIRKDSPFLSELHMENICENIDAALARIHALDEAKKAQQVQRKTIFGTRRR